MLSINESISFVELQTTRNLTHKGNHTDTKGSFSEQGKETGPM